MNMNKTIGIITTKTKESYAKRNLILFDNITMAFFQKEKSQY